MKRPSQRQIQSFIDLQTRIIVAGGGTPNEGAYSYVIHSKGGPLGVKPMGDWVACRFDDIEQAKRAGVPFNPLNGKCNFHDAMTVEGAAAFEAFMRAVAH